MKSASDYIFNIIIDYDWIQNIHFNLLRVLKLIFGERLVYKRVYGHKTICVASLTDENLSVSVIATITNMGLLVKSVKIYFVAIKYSPSL